MSKTLKELRQKSSTWEDNQSKHLKNKLKAVAKTNRTSTRPKHRNDFLNHFEEDDEESFYYRERPQPSEIQP